MLYAKCENGQVRISLTKPDDSWIELDATLSDKIVCQNGKPVVVSSLEYEKQKLISKLKSQLSDYILSYYPIQKQQYDFTKKDFWSTWLISKRSDLTLDQIGQTVYNDAAKILSGESTFHEVISNYPTTTHEWNGIQIPESMAWIELLKVAIRIGWVKLCTTIFDTIEQEILKSTDLMPYKSLDITSKLPPWPNI